MIDNDRGLCPSMVDLMGSVGPWRRAFGVVQFVRCSSAQNEKLRERSDMTSVILMTALPERDLQDEAILAGAQGLLRKPFESKSPLDWIERSLSDERPSR
jgi:hypothetical protein